MNRQTVDACGLSPCQCDESHGAKSQKAEKRSRGKAGLDLDPRTTMCVRRGLRRKTVEAISFVLVHRGCLG